MDVTYGSSQYLHIPVTSVDAVTGSHVTLTAPPRIALITDTGTAPPPHPASGDWITGEWVNGHARILLSPILALGYYRVWVTFTAGAETITAQAGWLHIT